jgi:hypothetical protein
MIFSGFRKDDVRDFEQALFVPMDYTRFRGYSYYSYGESNAVEVDPVTIEGDLPHRSRVTQEIAQWSPQLNRVASFEPLGTLREPPDADVFEFRGDDMTVKRFTRGVLPQPFVKQLCNRPQRGLFSVVSQISPKPDADFEDLALHDPTDAGATLRVAVYQERNDIIVLRSRGER